MANFLTFFLEILLPGRWRARRRRWRRSKRIRRLPHEAQERGLWRSELLSHQGLWPPWGWRKRRRGLAKLTLWQARLFLTSTGLTSAVGVVARVATKTLELIRAWAVAVPSSVPVGGRGRGSGAVSIVAVTAVAAEAASVVFAAAAAAGAAAGAHAAVALLLVHEVRVAGVATTVTHSATASSAAATWVHELKQFGVDGLAGLRQHPDQVSSLPQVPWGEEGVRSPLVGTAGCASNAVDVILRGAGIVVVDDELDIFHIFRMKSNRFYSTGERRNMIISKVGKKDIRRKNWSLKVCIKQTFETKPLNVQWNNVLLIIIWEIWNTYLLLHTSFH